MRDVLGEFRAFVLRGNVIDLAVAVVIGSAFGAVVTSLVENILTPILAALGGQPDFSGLSFTVNNSMFQYGLFVNALISFLIIAAVLFFLVVKPINVLMARFKPTAEEPTPTRPCPECLSSIPAKARRCAFCTTQLDS